MQPFSALRCATDVDDFPSKDFDDDEYDFDNDEDRTNPVNQINPRPLGSLQAAPHGRLFLTKEDAILEASRRAANLQETRSPGDIMPPLWEWEGKPSPEENEEKFDEECQAEEEFRAMYGRKNKRARKKIWKEGDAV